VVVVVVVAATAVLAGWLQNAVAAALTIWQPCRAPGRAGADPTL
jgi:hypothetical protein